MQIPTRGSSSGGHVPLPWSHPPEQPAEADADAPPPASARLLHGQAAGRGAVPGRLRHHPQHRAVPAAAAGAAVRRPRRRLALRAVHHPAQSGAVGGGRRRHDAAAAPQSAVHGLLDAHPQSGLAAALHPRLAPCAAAADFQTCESCGEAKLIFLNETQYNYLMLTRRAV